MRYCFLQVSDNLINPPDPDDQADRYFKEIWDCLKGEGYVKPDHYWEIPTWIAELTHVLKRNGHEVILHHIQDGHDPEKPNWLDAQTILPEANVYLASVLDCNKHILRHVIENNRHREFHLGGYIGTDDADLIFRGCRNVSWYNSIRHYCEYNNLDYDYDTDYTLFEDMECIPRLTMSNGCKHGCKFCSIENTISHMSCRQINNQIESMRSLKFQLVYISDKTYGQANNWKELRYLYNSFRYMNPYFRGFTVQTSVAQLIKFQLQEVDLRDHGIVNVEVGIESYNDDILKQHNKPQCLHSIERAMDYLRKQGVNIIPNIIIGLPGEDIYTYANTIEWLAVNQDDFLMINITNFVPYEGTEMRDMAKTAEDCNQTKTSRSWHTVEEGIDADVFAHELYHLATKVIHETKRKGQERCQIK